MSTLADIFTHGIDAYAEIQTARYQPNNPQPNVQTPAGQSTPAGESYRPGLETLQATFTNPTNLILLGVAAVLVVFLVRR